MFVNRSTVINPSPAPLVPDQKHWFNGHMSSAPTQCLAVVFIADSLCAVLWQYLDKKVTILGQSKCVPVKSWKLHDINAAIDSTLDELGEAGLTIKNVLFCVPNNWLENDSLQSEKKHILKTITQDLLLEPLGFVVNSDAMAANERDRTGQTFSGSFLSASQHFIEVERYERGNLVQSERIGRSGEIEQDVQEFFARFPENQRDARCILVSNNDQEELEKALSAKRTTPLEHLSVEQAVKMIVQTGGAETLQAQTPGESTETPAPVLEVEETSTETNENGEFTLPAFLNNNAPENPMSATDKPLMNTPQFVVHGAAPAPLESDGESNEMDAEEETIEPTPAKKPFRLPKLTLPNFSQRKAVPLIVIGLFLLVGLGAAGAFFTLQQSAEATISVWVQPETLRENQTFLIVTTPQSSASQSSLVAETFTESVVVDKEVPTTGTKIIGDPAKGKVTVYNRTNQEKTFAQGTKIVVGKYTFTFDEEVKVASASSGNDYSTVPGTKETNVTAAAIGPESNLEKDQEFSIANFDKSSYVAKNPNAFAGGSSREIQAVAKKDIDQAVSDLTQAANSQLKETIESQGTEDSPVLFGQQVRVTKTDTSAKVGDEQKFVTVTITVEANGLRIPPDELQRVAAEAFAGKLKPGQQLQPDKISIATEGITGNASNLQLSAALSAQVLPEVSASELERQLLGQYVPRAETILKETPGIARSEIRFEPAWMKSFVRNLPKDANKIEFTIRIEGGT